MKGFQQNIVFFYIIGILPFVTFGSEDRLLEHFRKNNRAKFTKEGEKGRGWYKPRPILPKNWKDSAGSLNCDTSHTIGTAGYKRFSINSKNKDCSYEFIGTKSEGCTVAILCDGALQLGSSPCTNSYLKLSDGTVGFKEICGNFDFQQRPYKPRNSGSDMYVLIKGSSSAKCVAFCLEDADSSHSFKKAHRLPKSTMDQGYTSGQCTCGVVNNKGRVVGGETARKFEFPWIGNLVVKTSHKGWERVPFCGLSLISDTYAISAAHCFFDQRGKWDPSELQALFHSHVVDKTPNMSPSMDKQYSWVPGWNLPKETDKSEGSIRVDIAEIITHPFFDGQRFDYDVALLKLKTKVNLESGKVSTICLPYLNEKLDYTKDTKFIVAGWGKPDEETDVSVRVLQKLTLPFIDRQSCEYYTSPSMRHVCAGYMEGGKDACQGDSGGPLIYKIDESKNQYILAGLVSSGAGCARHYSPGLYSDMRELVQWVYRNMADGTTKICPR